MREISNYLFENEVRTKRAWERATNTSSVTCFTVATVDGRTFASAGLKLKTQSYYWICGQNHKINKTACAYSNRYGERRLLDIVRKELDEFRSNIEDRHGTWMLTFV